MTVTNIFPNLLKRAKMVPDSKKDDIALITIDLRQRCLPSLKYLNEYSTVEFHYICTAKF